MSSFFYLELDTTSPQVEIYAPSYVTQNSKTIITIESSEKLSEFQEIYIIDSVGERHDLTFLHDENRFIGSIYLTNYPLGLATVYAIVEDEVGNISDLISKQFNIVKVSTYSISMKIKSMDTNSDHKSMSTNKSLKKMNAISTIKGGLQ